MAKQSITDMNQPGAAPWETDSEAGGGRLDPEQASIAREAERQTSADHSSRMNATAVNHPPQPVQAPNRRRWLILALMGIVFILFLLTKLLR